MYFIFGNYGDNTVAVIQWAYIRQLSNVSVIHVDTGWSAPSWQERVQECQKLLSKYGFQYHTLTPKLTFTELVRDRQEFPSEKYQWCSTFLKALPLLSFLDDVDPGCEATMLLGSGRDDSRARLQLSEFSYDNEYYGGRTVWYPLFDKNTKEKQALITEAGLPLLGARSLECQLCIHSSVSELKRIDPQAIDCISSLEEEIAQPFFHARYSNKSIKQLSREAGIDDATSLENFDAGCGSRYVCGE